ncbi:unnamed protein product [Rotaria sp. Silwood2]|nr:unnamed protein product [Rotaria sp. Silwood2]
MTVIEAHIAENLCTNVILGMDYINLYNLGINVKHQTISIEHENRLLIMPIDLESEVQMIRVVSLKSIYIPAYSTRSIEVTIPIPSMCSVLLPNKDLGRLNGIFISHTLLNFRNHRSTVSFINTSASSHVIKKGFCIGYIKCSSPMITNSKSSNYLCESSDATSYTGVSPVSLDLHDTNRTYCPLRSCFLPSITFPTSHRDHTAVSSSNPISANTLSTRAHIDTLVKSIENKEHKDKLYSLLNRFIHIFDTSRHSIANTTIHHVINTIPHSPPACKPYPQPDKEQPMYELMQEFLKAGLISESHSPYAAPALLIKEPRTLAQANKFVGALSWYRKFLPSFATIASPIHAVTNLTKDKRYKFKWYEPQSKAFNKLKQMLISEPLFLHYPVDGIPLMLTTDASGIGIGGVLQQEVGDEIHNLYYHSQLMTPSERKYSAIEKEALAIYKCFQRMRTFLLGRSIILRTDHCPLCHFMEKNVRNVKVERIAHLIQEFNIEKVIHIKGRENCLPDFLSRYSNEMNDDLFEIEYGLESKAQSSVSKPLLTSTSTKSPSCKTNAKENILASMVLRSHTKQQQSSSHSNLTNKTLSPDNRINIPPINNNSSKDSAEKCTYDSPFHIHCHTPQHLILGILNKIANVRFFTISTKCEEPTSQHPNSNPALLQIQAVHHQTYSTIILIEVQYLPPPSSSLFTLIRQLCQTIFSNSKTIMSWGNVLTQLHPFEHFNLFDISQVTVTLNFQELFSQYWNNTHPHIPECLSRRQFLADEPVPDDVLICLVNTDDINDDLFPQDPTDNFPNCICPETARPYKDTHTLWSIQKAIQLIFNQILDRSLTTTTWSCGLDPHLHTGRTAGEQHIRQQLISHAINDTLAPTKLLCHLDKTNIHCQQVNIPVNLQTLRNDPPDNIPVFLVLSDSHGKYLPPLTITSTYKIIVKSISGLHWVHRYNKNLCAQTLILSSDISSIISICTGIVLLIGTNSVRNLPSSQAIDDLTDTIHLIRSNYNHLRRKINISICSTFPCLKPSSQYPSTTSLLSNLIDYNTRLYNLSNQLNFSIVDLPINNYHISPDGIHLDVQHQSLLFDFIQQHLIQLINKIHPPTHNQRSHEAKVRRNHKRHQRLKQKQKLNVVIRSIDPVWQLKYITSYLKDKNIKCNHLPQIRHHQIFIQFNNSTRKQEAEQILVSDVFDEHHYYQWMAQQHH